MCIQRQRRATRSSRRYPFNENSKHSNRPFRGNYCNDRNRVIHANSLPFVLFFSFFFFHACVQPRSRRAKSRDFFPNKLHRTTRSPFLHVAAYLSNEFLTDPQNFISSSSNLPPRLTSIQFNSSREPSLESTRTVFSPPLFPYFLASYPSEPPSEFFQIRSDRISRFPEVFTSLEDKVGKVSNKIFVLDLPEAGMDVQVGRIGDRRSFFLARTLLPTSLQITPRFTNHT